jgi:hypothetical protein
MTGQDWLGLAAVALGFAGLVFIGFELRQQRQVAGYVAYQGITQQYSDLLWTSLEHADLDSVWDPLAVGRRHQLSDAQADEGLAWGAWTLMNPQERRLYRTTRRAIEIFEQAHFARELGWLGSDTSEKWDEIVHLWTKSSFFEFAWYDARRLVRPSFALYVDARLGPGTRPHADRPDHPGGEGTVIETKG